MLEMTDANKAASLTAAALDPAEFRRAVKDENVQAIHRPSLSYWKDAWLRLKRNRQALASLIIIVSLLLFTTLGPFVWPLDPAAQDLARISEGPSISETAVVLPELEAYEDLTAPASAGIEDAPAAPAAPLEAPEAVSVIGLPSTEAVRLKWEPVRGAAGYVIYRSEGQAPGENNLGIPIAEVDGGRRISYEDRFNLQKGTYYYSVVAKNGEESALFTSTQVILHRGIPLYEAQKMGAELKPGDKIKLSAHPLGTDYVGRDILARLIAGARVSLFIGFMAPLFSLIIGLFIGGLSGFIGGTLDQWLMRFTDFVLALPFLLFMILFKVAFGAGAGESGVMPMLVAMILLSWTSSARLTRGQILQLRESEFVQASRLLGAGSFTLLFRHMLPNTMGVILVSLTFAIPSAIFTEAFLSFIGMGVVPPTPSWGSMCNDGIQTFLVHPHEFLFPAVLISLTVLAFNLLGDGLRDALDPKMRSSQ